MVKTQVLVLISAVLIFSVVLNLVRLRRLREEYSWLWLAAAFFYLIMAIKPDLIANISAFFGITNTITAFIFFGLLFIILILINYSVRLSKLSTQMKDVAQQIAIIEGDQNELNRLSISKDGGEPDNSGQQADDKKSISHQAGVD